MKRYLKYDIIIFSCCFVVLLIMSIYIILLKNTHQIQLQQMQEQLDNQSSTVIYVEIQKEQEQEEYSETEKNTFVSLYDQLTSKEIELIELTVQHEVGSFSKEYRRLVAGIIRNRLESPIFPNTISDVLLAPGQFTDGHYEGVIVDEQTKEAVKEVFSAENSIHSATSYYNPALSAPSSIRWFEESGDVTYLFSYAEDNWGTTYTTRFFQ